MENQLQSLLERHAPVLLKLRTLGIVRSVEVQRGCLFVHAEAASEALRTQILRDHQTDDMADLRIAVTVNSALSLAEVNGSLATGVGTLGNVGGALEVGPKY